MPHLLDLCNEVLQLILVNVELIDLGTLSRTCRALRAFIRGNELLHKEVYLRDWDPPLEEGKICWIDAAHGLVRARRIIAVGELRGLHPEPMENSKLALVTDVITKLLRSSPHGAPSKNMRYLTDQSEDARIGDFLAVLLKDRVAPTQHHAKLSVLHGSVDRTLHRRIAGAPVARARVYDLSNYIAGTRWGPFRRDGSTKVDWRFLEAIKLDLEYNVSSLIQMHPAPMISAFFANHNFHPKNQTLFHGAVPGSFTPNEHLLPKSRVHATLPKPLRPQPNRDLVAQDPYNVTGTYHRVVCFLDYPEFYAFNFTTPKDPGEAERELDTEEATRLIVMRLVATKIVPGRGHAPTTATTSKPPSSSSSHEASEAAEDPGGPTVHFEGTSRRYPDNLIGLDPDTESRIRGKVRRNAEGELWWTTVSLYDDDVAPEGEQERWRSEGVQVGGPNSGRGVMGTWFAADYDEHGPAGPTAFWKVSDAV